MNVRFCDVIALKELAWGTMLKKASGGHLQFTMCLLVFL